MDQAQVALKLMLDDLGMAPRVRTVSERKAVQKAIYLSQAAGVDLGYRYNWYVMGPYSPGLTRDYFSLAESLRDGGDDSPRFSLQRAVRDRLDAVRPLLEVPQDVPLAQPDWLELVASVHFLVRHRRLTLHGAREVLNKEKTHVSSFTDAAAKALQDGGLLQVA